MTAKEQYFVNGERFVINYQPEEEQKKWRQEEALVNCGNCLYRSECDHCFKKERFPSDAGGDAQCLRLAQHMSKYAFINCNHNIIVIPDEIIEKIKDEIIAQIGGLKNG